jgi:hypothetical protein
MCKVTLIVLLQLVDALLAHILYIFCASAQHWSKCTSNSIAWQRLLKAPLLLKALMEEDFALMFLHVGPDVTVIASLHLKVVPL